MQRGIHNASSFNNLGWETKTIDAKGQGFITTYDTVGNVKTQIENGARTTKYDYDLVNRLTDTNIRYGSETTNTHTEYDAVGNVKSFRDAENHATRYDYDAVNRRILVIDAKNQKTKTEYDEVGNVTRVITDPFGTPHQMVYGYDALNRKNDVTDGEGIITRTTFNEFGNVVSVTENYTGTNTRTTQYKYDKLGRRIEVIDPANHSTKTKYDEASNVTGVIDANQNQTSYYYDRLNRQTEIVDANGILTQQTKYDGFGNVKSIRDSGGNITGYDYDALNRQVKMTDPLGKSVTQDYDALSRVEWVVDRNSRRRDFSYDINDNLTKEAWGNGTQLQFIYDKVGNLKQSIDGTSNTTNIYNYDEIYQLTDATTGNVNFHYDYDVYGDMTKRQERVNSLPTATVDYQYDKNHQLKKLSQSGLGVIAQVMEFGYDRLNQLTNISRTTANADGALVTDYQYNQVGLLKDINNYFVKPTVFNPTTTISNYHYDYDAGNRLTLKSGTDGNSVIDYGKDNQLKSVDNSSRADEAYNFNALGIRNNWSTVTGDSRQVQNDGKFEYKYDDEGNLTRKTELASGNITNYEWDHRNRLSKVSSASQIVEYQYDAEDRRVGKAINGVTKEKYIYDGQDIALVVGAAGTITERYLYGAGVDNVLSKEANGVVTWSLGDRQGSIVDLVNEQSEMLNHFVYDSFGNRTGTTTADFRFGYTGRELDTETGLYYYRARYFDSTVGRFISEDPIGFSAGDTNLYRYVGNNATNYTDPSGELIFAPLLA
jgi:RHS repeat-associated protein